MPTRISQAHDLPATADVVIVGGGVVGASTAFQLTRHGVRDVVLLERTHLAAGASGKSGALVRAHYSNTPETQLTLESLKIFREWEERVGAGNPGLQAVGFLRVVHPEDESKLRINVEMQQQLGGRTWIVEKQEIEELEPLLYTGDISIAAWEPDTGYADGPSTVYGFAQAAINGGARIFEQTKVMKINVSGGRVIGVETSRGHIATPVVVVAAGGYALPLFRPLGIEIDLYPRRIQVAVFRWPFQMDQHRPHRVVIDSINRSWMRPEGMAGTLIGVESRSGVAVDPVNYDETVEQDYVDRARRALTARFPIFDGALMRGSWSGVVMQSPDDHPIIDQIPDIGGLFVSTGDSGSSFKTGPAVGLVFAEWITSGEPQLMDMSPFRASRFAEGKPWEDQHGYTTGTGHSVSR